MKIVKSLLLLCVLGSAVVARGLDWPPTFGEARPTVVVPDMPVLPVVPGTVDYRWTGTGAVTDGANWEGGTSPFSGGTLDNKGNVVIGVNSATVSGLNVTGGSDLFQSVNMDASGSNYVQKDSTLNVTDGTLTFGRLDVCASGVLNISGENTKVTATPYFIIGSNDYGTSREFARMYMSGGLVDTGSASFYCGWQNHAQIVQSGGEVKVNASLLIGSDRDARGEYYMVGPEAKITTKTLQVGFQPQTDGLLYVDSGTVNATTANIGTGGKGTLIMTGNNGATLTSTTFNVGQITNNNNKNSNGTVFLDGNASISANEVNIGSSQIGKFYMDGGSMSAKVLRVGYENGSNGSLMLSGGNVSTNSIEIAQTSASVGKLNQTGGTIESQKEIYVGRQGVGSMDISGGELKANSSIWVGYSPDVNVRNVIELSGTGHISANTYLVLGAALNVSGQTTSCVTEMNITGGSVTGCGGGFYAGWQGTGIVNQSAGLVDVGGVLVSCDSGTGGYNLSGGTVKTGKVTIGKLAPTDGVFRQTGGTLTTNKLAIGENGKGSFVKSGGTATVGELSINAQSSLKFVAGNNGFGSLNVTGALTNNGKISVDVGSGLALLTNYDTANGITLMTVGSGAVTAESLSPLVTTDFSDNKLTLKMAGTPQGSLDAISGKLTLDTPSAEGWVYLENLTGSDPFQLTFTLADSSTRDAALAQLQEDLAISNGGNQIWTADEGALSDQILVTGITAAMSESNVFAWNFSDTGYANALLAGVQSQQVPEPAAWLLLLAGVCVLKFASRKRR